MDMVLIAVIKEGNNVQQNCSAAQQIGLNVPLLSVSATCTDDIKNHKFLRGFPFNRVGEEGGFLKFQVRD